MNPGRYVGVVIEEGGKTEEEFIESIIDMNDELEKLNTQTHGLEVFINHKIRVLTGEK